MLYEKNGSQIKEIKYLKKNILLVFQDDSKLELDEKIFSDFYLYPGKILNEEELSLIKKEIHLSNAKNYALSLLSKRMYSEKEIKEKLKSKNFLNIEIQEILSNLISSKLIDDQKYAIIIKEELDHKLYGQNKIKNYLRQKGISEKMIDKLEFNQENEEKKIIEYLKKIKQPNNKSEIKFKNDVISKLTQNGFSYNHISNVVNLHQDIFTLHNQKEILFNFLEKYVIIHKVDLCDYDQKQKVIKRYLNRGFSLNEINETIRRLIDGKID